MNLPKVISDLVEAQAHFDSAAYTNCFTDTAVVFDEGKTHTGKTEIEKWISHSNETYQSTMKPLAYDQTGDIGILSAEVAGTFPGSPLVLKFNFELHDGLIQSLKVTG